VTVFWIVFGIAVFFAARFIIGVALLGHAELIRRERGKQL
jgi:hypothetical protein